LDAVNLSQAPEYILFGGSFDPIHYGHLFIAEAARAMRKAARVIFLPTRSPRHRAALREDAHDRAEMVRAAIVGNPHFTVDLSDLDDEASGYSIDVLPRLFARYPTARFSFLVGEDSLTASAWYRFDEVVAMVDRFLVAPRHEDAQGSLAIDAFLAGLTPQTRAKIELLEQPRMTISASAIRASLAHAGSIRYLVPEGVRSYILSHGLYGSSQ
jgi:nicotinate-nucleotide adenylyltransferase